MRTPWARLVACAAFAVVLGATFFLGHPRAAKAKAVPAAVPEAGDPGLIDLDGYKNVVGKYRGKGVMVSFWATWSVPSRNEYPMIVSLAKEYEHQGLAVVGVDLDEDATSNLCGISRRQWSGLSELPRKIWDRWGRLLPGRESRLAGRDAANGFLRARWPSGALFRRAERPRSVRPGDSIDSSFGQLKSSQYPAGANGCHANGATVAHMEERFFDCVSRRVAQKQKRGTLRSE